MVVYRVDRKQLSQVPEYSSSKVCQRCGASAKEAQLTKSHVPRTAVFKQCCGKGWKKKQKIYKLCHHCHGMYTRLEQKILLEACQKMYKLHLDYIGQ